MSTRFATRVKVAAKRALTRLVKVRKPTAEPLALGIATHAEGPFWDAARERLLVMDVLAASVLELTAAGEVLARHAVPGRAATIVRRRKGGGFVVATDHRVLATDDFDSFASIAAFESDPDLRSNDGGVDSLGGLVLGTMAYDERPNAGRLLRVGPGGDVQTLIEPMSIPNGLQFDQAHRVAFHVDTRTRVIRAFDVDDDGRWSAPRVHADLHHFSGWPDGMAIDQDGGLWVAMWGAGEVRHFDEVGELVDVVRVPGVTQTSSCAFGGADGRTLFITVSRKDLPSDAEPAAGSVFAIDAEVRGAELRAFG